MAATTMMFGPEWMRTKRAANAPSPPPATASPNPAADGAAGAYTYSKDELLRIYKDGGGRGGLARDVERWEGVVRPVGAEPAALKEPTPTERALFAGPLNSELRRRQSTEQFSPLTIGMPKINGALGQGGAPSPLRERFSSIARRDAGPLSMPSLPRKLSLTGTQLGSPREPGMPSPRLRGPLTPGGIDGVLSSSGSDSWMARRRASLATPRGEDADGGGGAGGGELIKEEREEEGGADASENWRAKGARGAEPGDPGAPAKAGAGGEAGGEALAAGVAGLGLGIKNGVHDEPAENAAPASSAPAKPPGLPQDVAAIEWQYLDPQGNIQGPFRANLMAQWHQQGYFAPSLLMKRTTIDEEWTQFGVLTDRHGANVFLTAFDPIQSAHPPPEPAPPPHNNGFGAPHQPIPQRQAHVAALEAYYTPSPASHSPASSFGGGRLANHSPDPAAFAARSVGGGMGMADSPRMPRAIFAQDGRRQQSYTDAAFDQQHTPEPFAAAPGAFTTPTRFGPVRTASSDSYGLGGANGFNGGTPWGAQNGLNIRTASLDTYGSPFGAPQEPGYAHSPLRASAVAVGAGVASAADPFVPREQPRAPPQQAFDPAPQQQPFAASPALAHAFAQSPAHTYAQPVQHPRSVGGGSTGGGSAWLPPAPAEKPRGAPFAQPEAFPTARNTMSTRDRDAWAPAPAPPAAWAGAHTVDEAWREVQGPNSLTVSNLGQHNLQQQKEEAAAKAAAGAVAVVETPVLETPPPIASAPAPAPAAEPAPKEKEKARRKASAAPAPPAAPEPAEPAPATEAGAAVAAARAVWAADEKKAPGVLSLREIQEAETRRQEERKLAERERRLLAATAPAPEADAPAPAQQLSWGLPTSKAGAAPAPKAPSPVNGAGGAAPVWGAAAAAAAPKKKTMKEIQEEEERRRVREAREAAARGKAYAETTTKAPPAPAPVTGGAWTTVGAPAAKPAAAPAATSLAARTAPAPAAAPAVRKPAAAPTPAPAPAPVAAKPVPVAKAAPKPEPAPAAPSAEFMKWLSDNLKALTNGVEYDAIVSMLLSFPLDVDASTAELISDLIYANSATLDGRRFAAEFASRRKADAARAPGARAVSAADVVKAPPRAAPGNEWGGFKVVNKKKKGGKA